MAKKQTFTSKLNKGGKDFKFVKHIKSVVSEDTGHIKFLHNMVRLEENENLDQALKRMEEESMQGLSFGKPDEDSVEEVKEAPAEETKEADAEEVNEEDPTEEVKEESPAEETKEADAEEVKEEAPAEEAKEEAPAEEVEEEDSNKEVKEEAPAEEIREEAEPATEDQSAEKADDSSDK